MKPIQSLVKLRLHEEIPPKIVGMLIKVGVLKTIKLSNNLIEVGSKCQEIYFILEGGFISQYLIKPNRYSTVNFYLYNYQSFVTIPNAYFNNEESYFQLKAIKDSSVLCFQKKHLEALVRSSKDFAEWYQQKIILALVEEYKAKAELIIRTSRDMYIYLMKNKPEIIQQVPSIYIAQYLGISRQHLSRLRNQITRPIC